ncbi:DNA (cytosine-5-)-methyltransferase [Candidatus Hakubella thermalkaliphila]|uniref:Methyltransferase n=1 Tax=Candidatus Hakubella thermalkaliphila TaxID=2754717 RepID=A0A6V8P708_9ACTN|nr:DNA (cytosine-5-)-methyltransferase [Candidatus Hakubella thermalkaliphila]GFP28178.1 site-specific DNA-methyltransferase (adenine-specific) [Candidatus Hakubella thermalkaliphila]
MKPSKVRVNLRETPAWRQLGERLRAARLSRGWSLADLAGRLHVSKGYVSRLECGKARPALTMVAGLGRLLGIETEELLIWADFLPDDVKRILCEHSGEALALLRESFGNRSHDLDQADAAPLAVREPSSHYAARLDLYELVHGDCFAWLDNRESNSIHAIVTDPPYGLKEYTAEETTKLRRGRGGVWRIPPTFDGFTRRPLPRFTVLSDKERLELKSFFVHWAASAIRVLVPGGHVFIATNPLLSHLVYVALIEAGFEKRGEIIRLVQTLRGGDRPKNAHKEFDEVTVMPRSCWEPWGLFRKPCEGRVQDNLRKWKTGGLRRVSEDQPFCDVIRSSPTRTIEREIAPHPSLKPQAFMRQIVRAALPLGEGIVLDPFTGGGSTIAAACAVGYRSIGIEHDLEFFAMARRAIPQLAVLVPNGDSTERAARGSLKTTGSQASLFG